MHRSAPPEGWWHAAFQDEPTPSERIGHKCGDKNMLMIVAYDIADRKRLSKVAKLCEDYGVRVQYSIFECQLQKQQFGYFWGELSELIDPDEDRITAYRVCAKCAGQIRDAGVQEHYAKAVAYVF